MVTEKVALQQNYMNNVGNLTSVIMNATTVHCTQLISLLMFLQNFHVLQRVILQRRRFLTPHIQILSEQEDITSLKSEVTFIVFQVYAFVGFSSDERGEGITCLQKGRRRAQVPI